MSQGKFSRPRPYREEDRQIEKAYRQVTGQEPISPPPAPEDWEHYSQISVPEAVSPLSEEVPVPEPISELSDSPVSAPDGCLPEVTLGEARFASEDPDVLSDTLSEEDWEEDDTEASENPFLSFLSGFADFLWQNKRIALVGLCAAALVLIISIISVFFASTSDPYDRKILNNVYVAGVNLGGMSKSDAVNAVKKASDLRFSQEDMVLDLSGTELRLTPAETSVKLNVKSAVNAAYDYGRKGTNAEKAQAYQNSLSGMYIVDLSPYLDVNERRIRERLENYAEAAGNTLTQTSYGLEGKQPELSADKFDKNAPGQTLVILMGTPGLKFDISDVMDQILDAYGRYEFHVVIEGIAPTALPEPIDLARVYDEFYIAPADASVDPETRETIPASYGYSFDLEAAQALVDQAAFGQEIRIPMAYIEPEILEEDMLFQDILGEYQTAATRNEDRNVNLSLACQAINGVILEPGETFSFNDTLGQPTAGKGYRYAPFDKDSKDTAVGGGISQVASTLYCSALLADMDIRTQKSHAYPVSYMDHGLDADVTWGTGDLRFSNTTDYPIQIQAVLSNSTVTVLLLGRDQRTHYVRLESRIQNTYVPDTEYQDFAFDNEKNYKDGDMIQEGRSGYLVKVFRVEYDRQSNQKLSREEIASVRYQTLNEILARVEPEPTTMPETEPPAEPTAPSTQPVTQPSETTQETTQETSATVPTTEASTVPATQPPATPATEGSDSSGFSDSQDPTESLENAA